MAGDANGWAERFLFYGGWREVQRDPFVFGQPPFARSHACAWRSCHTQYAARHADMPCHLLENLENSWWRCRAKQASTTLPVATSKCGEQCGRAVAFVVVGAPGG